MGGESNLNKGKLGGWVEIAPQRGRSWPGAQHTRDRGQEPPAQGAAGPLPAAAHRLSGHAPARQPPAWSLTSTLSAPHKKARRRVALPQGRPGVCANP